MSDTPATLSNRPNKGGLRAKGSTREPRRRPPHHRDPHSSHKDAVCWVQQWENGARSTAHHPAGAFRSGHTAHAVTRPQGAAATRRCPIIRYTYTARRNVGGDLQSCFTYYARTLCRVNMLHRDNPLAGLLRVKVDMMSYLGMPARSNACRRRLVRRDISCETRLAAVQSTLSLFVWSACFLAYGPEGKTPLSQSDPCLAGCRTNGEI